MVLVASIGLAAVACTDERPAGDGAAAPGGDTGATVVINAIVHTVDPDNPTAEAFAYDDEGTIVAVGDEAEVRDAAGDEPTVIDAGGATVLPGFQDAHVHVPEAGINETTCVMEGSDLADLEAGLAEQAAILDQQCDILGRDPTDLDRVLLSSHRLDRPVVEQLLEICARVGMTDLIVHDPRPGDSELDADPDLMDELAEVLR